MNFAIGETLGDYEIVSVLGSGGMGRVYKARNTLSNRLEAMKVLLPGSLGSPDADERFLREIRVQASLDHPNIAALRTALRIDNQIVMIMELVHGTSLQAILDRGPLSVKTAVDYFAQVLSALSYAHSQGVIHRDIKPSNIMITGDGIIKLTDFGIAKLVVDRSLTQIGATGGSVHYMSPEQVEGRADLDSRSDLYEVGVTLYQAVTGSLPFVADTDFAVYSAHLNAAPVPPEKKNPGVPQELSRVILKALAKKPSDRFQTALEFRTALLASSLPVEGSATSFRQPLENTIGGGIFLNYRRDDSRADCGRLYDRLAECFPGKVFRDVGSLQPGIDWQDAIERVLSQSAACIVLIGQNWLTITDSSGRRRLDVPNDPVREEIVAVLKRGAPILPVLVGDAKMPVEESLPPDLRPLCRREALELTEQHWDEGFRKLVKALEAWLGELAVVADTATGPGMTYPLGPARLSESQSSVPVMELPKKVDNVASDVHVSRQRRSTYLVIAVCVMAATIGLMIQLSRQAGNIQAGGSMPPRANPPISAPLDASRPRSAIEPRGVSTISPAPKTPGVSAEQASRVTAAQETPVARGQKSIVPANKSDSTIRVPPQIEPSPASIAVHSEPRSEDAALLEELRERMLLLSSRLVAVRGSLNNLERQQNLVGLSLRADMAAARQSADYLMAEAGTALTSGDSSSAKRNLDLAERQVEKLERFLGL
jgi:serine/threonine protein kinase